jgi:hypothetical protein
MLLLEQTLTSLEKKRVLAQATQMGEDFHFQWAPIPQAPGNEEIEMPQIPTGAQAVPLADPRDANDPGNKWRRCHFIYLVVEGLKRAKVKPLNYSQVTTVQ